jgi:hypothetical protein
MKSHSNKTCLIVDHKAKKYVLKEKDDNIKRIKTTNNDIYVRYRKKLYCLYNYIAGKVYKNHYYAAGAEKRAYNYGKSIALLHKGLKKVNKHKNFTIMDLWNKGSGHFNTSALSAGHWTFLALPSSGNQDVDSSIDSI